MRAGGSKNDVHDIHFVDLFAGSNRANFSLALDPESSSIQMFSLACQKCGIKNKYDPSYSNTAKYVGT